MGKVWTGPAIVEMTLTELGQQTGRVTPELDSGGVLRLVNRRTRRTIGYIIAADDLPEHLGEAEELLGQPTSPRTRAGRAISDFQRMCATTGDLASLPAAAAARVLGLPERTVHNWRARARVSLNGASS